MSEGIGWLPVEARATLEAEQDRASAAEAGRLLALDPRARVLALLDGLGAKDGEGARLRPADLARVLESFAGAAAPDPAALAAAYPALVVAPP